MSVPVAGSLLSSRPVGGVLCLTLALALAGCAPEAGDADETSAEPAPGAGAERQEPSSEGGALPTSALKRLAEAADGYRTGGTLYLVYSHAFPHHVAGAFETEEEAEATASRLGTDFSVFSVLADRDVPRHEDPDFDRPALLLLGFDCPDHQPGSYCPPQRQNRTVERTIPFHEIDSTRVQVFHGGQVYREVVFGRDEVDALFLNLSAVEKFYVPYLARVYGVEFAADYRRNFVEWSRRVEVER